MKPSHLTHPAGNPHNPQKNSYEHPWEKIQEALKGKKPFQQSWQIRLSDRRGCEALELRFSFLVSRNGFRRLAEVSAIYFQKELGQETSKFALKQTLDPDSFKILPEGGFKIGNCEFSLRSTRGSIQTKGRIIEWNIALSSRQKLGFQLVPQGLQKGAVSLTVFSSIEADALFEGISVLNSKEVKWQSAPGTIGWQSGPQGSHSWIWAHVNHCISDSGEPVPFVFEGITIRGRLLGLLPSPQFSSFHFHYLGKNYHFNTLRDFLGVRSRYKHHEWNFQAERGEVVFQGHARIEHKDFAGLLLEDVHGSLHYCATSKLSDLEFQIYRRGKLEAVVRAEKSAAIEIVSRKKNPYVPLLT